MEKRTVLSPSGKARTEYFVEMAPEAAQSSEAQLSGVELDARRIELWKQFDLASERRKTRARDASMALRHTLEPNAPAPNKIYCSRQLRRFRAKVEGYGLLERPDDWAAALLDGNEGRPRERGYSARADDLFRAYYLRLDRPSLQSAFDRTAATAKKEGFDLPRIETLVRRMRRDLPWQAITLARFGPKALDQAHPAQERDRSVFRAMGAVCSDGWRADNLVRWPDGAVARPVIACWQDLYSGAILSWRVDRTENSDVIRLSFGDLLGRGIPEDAYIDNGRPYAAHWLSGRTPHRFRFKLRPEEPAGIFNLLGIRVHFTIPYSGRSKPIERAFRELTDRISRHPRLDGSWIGSNPVSRPDRVTRPAALADFLAVVAAEIKSHNERPGRRAKNCAGRSLWQTFCASYERGPVRKATAEQIALKLLAVEGVMVSPRDGTFRLEGNNRYYSAAVAAFAGRRIAVRFDPQNLQSRVFCYQISGELIGAADCILPVGFNDTHAAREHARARRQWARAQREHLESERRLSVADLNEVTRVEPATPELLDTKVVRLFRPPIEPPGPSDGAGSEPAWLESVESREETLRREIEQLKAKAPGELTLFERQRIALFETSEEEEIRRRGRTG